MENEDYDFATLDINADIIKKDTEDELDIINTIKLIKNKNEPFEKVLDRFKDNLIPHEDSENLLKVVFDNCESKESVIKAIDTFLLSKSAIQQFESTISSQPDEDEATVQIIQECLIIVQFLTQTAKGLFFICLSFLILNAFFY
jgi:hypothetical protein